MRLRIILLCVAILITCVFINSLVKKEQFSFPYDHYLNEVSIDYIKQKFLNNIALVTEQESLPFIIYTQRTQSTQQETELKDNKCVVNEAEPNRLRGIIDTNVIDPNISTVEVMPYYDAEITMTNELKAKLLKIDEYLLRIINVNETDLFYIVRSKIVNVDDLGKLYTSHIIYRGTKAYGFSIELVTNDISIISYEVTTITDDKMHLLHDEDKKFEYNLF